MEVLCPYCLGISEMVIHKTPLINNNLTTSVGKLEAQEANVRWKNLCMAQAIQVFSWYLYICDLTYDGTKTILMCVLQEWIISVQKYMLLVR